MSARASTRAYVALAAAGSLWGTGFLFGKIALAELGVPLPFLVQFEGLARTTVSHAALIVGTAPILIGMGAALFADERLTRRSWALLCTPTLGALLIAGGTLIGGTAITAARQAA
jgi:drug/metabolite transporter (DMT)-like permease